MRVSPRADLALVAGYHSPQVEAAVRLNTNESPEPPPSGWVTELEGLVGSVAWNRYPDRAALALRSAIGEAHGVGPEQVFAANGSNEVIQTLLLTYGGPGRRAVLWEPTYALHGHIARVTGTEVVEGERSVDFAIRLDEALGLLEQVRPQVVFLCSPNNPTGVVDPPEVVEAVLERVDAVGGLLVVDEAYAQFAPWTATSLLDDDRPLVVTRTFSKTWSAAALRLGYLLGPPDVVAEMLEVVLPYHLDTFTQLAGVAALSHAAEMDDRVARLVGERHRVEEALDGLPVHRWPSGANFVLFRPLAREGAEVWRGLLRSGVLVRDCSSWPRLSGCLRVTIGTRAENDEFLAALEEVLS